MSAHSPESPHRLAHIVTYGCQMNSYESAVMGRILSEHGYRLAKDPKQAQVIIINTCTVRRKPENKVYALLGELRRLKQARPDLRIVVCGCMAQLRAKELSERAPFLDAVLGTRNLVELREILAAPQTLQAAPAVYDEMKPDPFVEVAPAVEAGQFTAFVSIMQGCRNFCSYCVVPYVRGPERSRAPEEVVAEVAHLAGEGILEVCLLGQNVNAYGRDQPGVPSFAELLCQVCEVDGIWRVRFTTSHPKDFSEALIDVAASEERVCEHFHLPVQSGDDEVLARMNRGYDAAAYLVLVERLRKRVPGCSITTDAIVGFPGETEEQLENTLRLFETVRFDQAFMFAYCDRPLAAASRMPDKVPEATKQRRLRALIDLQNRISREKNEEQLGRVFEVLVEGAAKKGEGLICGRTRSNKLAHFPGPRSLAGSLVQVRTTQAALWGFKGELVGSGEQA